MNVMKNKLTIEENILTPEAAKEVDRCMAHYEQILATIRTERGKALDLVLQIMMVLNNKELKNRQPTRGLLDTHIQLLMTINKINTYGRYDYVPDSGFGKI
jgi:hypothetical protein